MMEVNCYSSIYAFRVLLSLLVICQLCFLATSSLNLATDQNALLALKSRITLDPDRILTNNWTNSSHVCAWIGVICGSRHNRVVVLDVSNMSLIGTIPPQLGNLSFLVSLNLGYNHFRGELPFELSRLRRLKVLDLKVNDFNQEVPPWLALLSKLEHLSLRNNSFTGYIPSSISKLLNLKILDFSSNSLRGMIPVGLGNLGRLQWLNMQYNYLSGPIPPALFNLSALELLGFTSNKLNGSLPTGMWLPLIRGIYLSSNNLSGEIPPNISACSQLRVLSLSYNSFTGQIPKALIKLKYLTTLLLGTNNLNGAIPQDIGSISQNMVMLGLENNQITGEIPLSIFNLTSLQFLNMGRNELVGSLSRHIGNLTLLVEFLVNENSLTGAIPQELGKLSYLVIMSVERNRFTAGSAIPHQLFNISTIQILSFTDTGVQGSLPASICDSLPVLERLLLGQNNLSGALPNSISNCSRLRSLSLSVNKFTGHIPQSLGSLTLLQSLMLNHNYLRSESSSRELSFITSLTNCKFLNSLAFGGNPIEGIIPISVGNLSTSLLKIFAFDCKIEGSIPAEIGNLTNLLALDLSNNALTGYVPLGVQRLNKMQGLDLSNNNLSGFIPEGFCNLHNLVNIHLRKNRFSGPIPECIGNLTYLRLLSWGSNMLTSSVPRSIWGLKDLVGLDLSSNYLTGSLSPEVGNLVAIFFIDLSKNHLSEYIPTTIGKLENLGYLYLAHNTLYGSIPVSLGSKINLQNLDLSYNNLSGPIPMSLQALQHLNKFNVSFNFLTGEIPSGGPFRNFTAESFKGNRALCGPSRFDVPPCPVTFKHGSRWKKVQVPVVIVGVVTLIIVVSFIYIFIVRYRRKGPESSSFDTIMPIIPERISYYELLRATEQFNESNLLGVGSFGSVYKGNFGEGKILAVKVFNLQAEAAFRSFDVECEVLRSIRHRNLTKVVGSCSNLDFKALLLQYMPNGNLEKRLYSRDDCLDMVQRLNIMIDVASALEYLHHGYSTPIVHCDLKPSNVLLDEDMTAHVSDFGIAKLLGEENSTIITKTLATLGYIAPEYGTEGLVSTRCDVFSYGIMLMETFTGKRPSDEMFEGDVSLRSWVAGLLPVSLDQIIDANLLNAEAEARISVGKILHCVSSILELALKCSVEYPKDRIGMKGAFDELQKIKCRFLA